ncbi:MAG TPA: DUF5050 domain-containing protein [Fimbriimonadaceae bacterium]|nr:DUF5050 domain-containing protein [Fimbriimonadaceae bacterium]
MRFVQPALTATAVMAALTAFSVLGSPSGQGGSAGKVTCAYCKTANTGVKVCKTCKTSVDYANFPVPTALAATGFGDEMPCWGPNGKIVYINGQGGRDVTIMNGDGSNPKKFPRGQNSLGDQHPFWGPNGKIVFAGGVTNQDVYVMDSDGSNRRKVTELMFDERMPTVNAEGKVVFASNHEQPADSGFNLFMVDLDGQNLKKLTQDGTFNFNPCWSPDGKRIAYNAAVGGTHQVFVMNADGTGVKQLTTKGPNYDPSWGPDGRIAFVSERDHEKGEIYIMKSDGTGQTRLTWNLWRDARPSLGAGGRLLFESDPNYGPHEAKNNCVMLLKVK